MEGKEGNLRCNVMVNGETFQFPGKDWYTLSIK